MLMNIFANTAPRYWEKGLPVIPLREMDKKAFTENWSAYAYEMPTKAEQDQWLQNHPHGNIGLVMGPCSDLLMVDIDTDDERIKAAILKVLAPFPSPWVRIGKKGMAIAYRQPAGGGDLRSFVLKSTETKKAYVELISTGKQLVLPPSIHPETKRPYVANCDLLDVLDEIPRIPRDIEALLRGAFEELGIPLSLAGSVGVLDFVSVGNRDNEMTRMAGLCAWAVTRGEKTFLEAQATLETKHEHFMEQVAGDTIPVAKFVQSMCGFLVRDVMTGKRTLPKGWDDGLTPEMKKGLGLEFDHKYEEWDYEELVAYIRIQNETHGNESKGWLDAVTYILERLARSPSLDQIMIERILRYMSDVTGGKLTVTALRKRMMEMKQGDIKGNDHTEIAQRVIEDIEQYGELRYHNTQFWQWAGSHWETKDPDDILRIISSSYGDLAAAKKYGDHVGIMKTMTSLIAKPLRTIDMVGVNFANGYLDTDLNLIQHDKEYGCTYTLPYRYLPELADQAVKFQAFLDRCFLDDEDREQKKMALQEALAITLFNMGTVYSRAVLLFGPANTGKSELLRMVEALVAENAKSALPPDMWHDKFGPAQLADKILNLAGELSEHKKIDGQIFKMVIDGSIIQAQHKNKPLFHFHPTAMHWFGSNHTPKTDDTSGGFLRRWVLIRFEHPITKEERIPGIAQKIVSAEREAIVAWAMQGMPRIRQAKEYTLPASHWRWIEEIANNNNSVRHFFRESGLVRLTSTPATGPCLDTSDHVDETSLYNAYLSWSMIAGGAARATLRRFKMQMHGLAGELGFQVRTVALPTGENQTRYYNLTLAGARSGR